MGKVFKQKQCDICKSITKVIETWGKKYCKSCWDKKSKKLGKGHSGMIKDKYFKMQDFLPFEKNIILKLVKKSNRVFSNIYLRHYPGSKGIVGRQVNYLILREGKIIGIIGANSPPLNYKLFRKYLRTNNEKLFLNNNVFCLIKHEKNLGTKVLKEFRKKIKRDYYKKYKDNLIGLITFVEPPRNGAIYKADNWEYLGVTKGKSCTRRGNHGKWINKEWKDGTKKHIFGIKLK